MVRSRLLHAVTIGFFVLAVAPAAAQWVNGQQADLVLGQSTFTTNVSGLAADSLNFPTGLAIDPTTGKLFVADIANHRVLRWPSVAALVSGSPAEAVFGQPDLESSVRQTTRDGMSFPTDVTVDAEGRLYVADAINNRVLRFDSASYKPTGANADGVLGQPDFTSALDTVTRNGMDYARGVTVDGAGTVWVSDQINDRVLRFDNAASKPNGADADGVLGQKDFTSKVQDTSRSGMNVPRGLAVDAEGRLWVATSFNHRVMRFDNAAAKPNGADADGVLGQQDFTSAVQATTPDGMREPIGVALDQTGRLYVTDNRNNRVLWFDSAASKPNGASADGVFGQPDFTSNEDTITDRGMWGPWGVTVEKVNGRIWVADSENQRVLRFSPTAPVSVDPGDVSAPGRFALHQNYPNPFNP
ncbi:MAG: NHL repeat-containing protein, partial [Bacteroidota bacterium]